MASRHERWHPTVPLQQPKRPRLGTWRLRSPAPTRERRNARHDVAASAATVSSSAAADSAPSGVAASASAAALTVSMSARSRSSARAAFAAAASAARIRRTMSEKRASAAAVAVSAALTLACEAARSWCSDASAALSRACRSAASASAARCSLRCLACARDRAAEAASAAGAGAAERSTWAMVGSRTTAEGPRGVRQPLSAARSVAAQSAKRSALLRHAARRSLAFCAASQLWNSEVARSLRAVSLCYLLHLCLKL